MFVPVCVTAYVCVSFNQVKLALHIQCHSLFHIAFNNYKNYNNYIPFTIVCYVSNRGMCSLW